ncbi:ankyrin repeat domain-containing protein [Streptomyces krungchingensis]
MAIEVSNVWTPAHQAIEDDDVDELARLLDAGGDPDEECCGLTLLAHAVDYEADSAIQSGGEMGVKLIATLLAYGALPQVAAAGGKGPLEIARDYRHEMAERLLLRFA